jgi:hypothetical protein
MVVGDIPWCIVQHPASMEGRTTRRQLARNRTREIEDTRDDFQTLDSAVIPNRPMLQDIKPV